MAIKAQILPVVANAAHHFPHKARDVHIAIGRYFSHHQNHAGRGGAFAGDPGSRILGKHSVQHGI
ncbi:hypothetical protein SDC9_142053 [bioreactor metagenome]|uniref:Uncharacterized protein n=1 Tax=bioreactor metagenome TaxID=1076179 RepID=A0A645DZE1_9ZZZZ